MGKRYRNADKTRLEYAAVTLRMNFPDFKFCILCDIVRPELGGKSILLGFYGVTPYVDIAVKDLLRPIFLSIVAGTAPVTDVSVAYDWVAVIARPDGVGIFQTPPLRLVVTEGKSVVIPLGFSIAPPILPGIYSIRITVNSQVKLDTSFSIRGNAGTDAPVRPLGSGAPN